MPKRKPQEIPSGPIWDAFVEWMVESRGGMVDYYQPQWQAFLAGAAFQIKRLKEGFDEIANKACGDSLGWPGGAV